MEHFKFVRYSFSICHLMWLSYLVLVLTVFVLSKPASGTRQYHLENPSLFRYMKHIYSLFNGRSRPWREQSSHPMNMVQHGLPFYQLAFQDLHSMVNPSVLDAHLVRPLVNPRISFYWYAEEECKPDRPQTQTFYHLGFQKE